MEIVSVNKPQIQAGSSRFLRFIEQSAQRLLDTNPFLVAAKHGKVRPEQLQTYLNNLRHLFMASNLSLKMASQAAQAQGKSHLADFYAKKVAEEAGHEKWAEADLAVNALQLFEEAKQASPSMRELVAYSRNLIHRSPELFLSYVLFLEYFTVLAGPEFLRRLNEECGISNGQVTALYNHVELDQQHAAEDNDLIAEMLSETVLSDQAYAALAQIERLISGCLADSLHHSPYAS